MSPFLRVIIPISVFFISGLLATGAMAQASQASVDALEVKADSIEQKIDAIEAKLDLPVLIEIDETGPKLDAIEAKADALEVKADTMGTNIQSIGATTNSISTNLVTVGYQATSIEQKIDAIEAKLDIPDIIEIDETGPKLDAIEAKLDTHLPVEIDVDLDPLADLGMVIEDKVDSNGDKIDLLEAKADLLETKIDSLGGDLGGLEDEILNLELEQAILACNCSPTVFLPASAGGNGERGIALVAGLLENIKITGVSDLRSRDLDRAECYMLEAQSLFDDSRYGTACEVLSGSLNILSFGKSKICEKARACERRGGDDDDDDD